MRELAAGNPVLVMQNLGLDWWPRWHYAVVVGYDMGRNHVILRSGETERRITQMRTFERTWMRADRWAQVVVAPDDPPATAEPVPWLDAVRELERNGQQQAAMTGYQAATQRWPEAQAAWLALGNARLGGDDAAGARAAYERVLALAPRAGDGWNNLAHALRRTGCGDSAVDAARCALRLAPENGAYDDTLDELTGGARTQGLQTQCAIPDCPVAAPADE